MTDHYEAAAFNHTATVIRWENQGIPYWVARARAVPCPRCHIPAHLPCVTADGKPTAHHTARTMHGHAVAAGHQHPGDEPPVQHKWRKPRDGRAPVDAYRRLAAAVTATHPKQHRTPTREGGIHHGH